MPPSLLFPADNSPLAAAVIKLYDAKGSLILMRQGKFPAGKNIMSIDMSCLTAGTYNLIAEWGAGFKKIKQLIKQH